MACANNVKIKVNDRFSTYKQFEEVLAEYKKSQLQEFWIRDARTISNQRKRFPETVSKANEELKYCYVRLSCIKGGRKFKSKNDNSTRQCTTLRQDCPATIFLKISPCQQALMVVEINEGHSHSTSKTAFNCLSQQRLKLPETVKQTAKDALKAGANKKIVLDNIRSETGSNITLKDLTNMVRRTDRKSFQECINVLKDVYNCDTVEVLVDQENVFKGLYFQDRRMKEYFAAFPEMLFIDGTYCLVDLRTATYLIMVEDGNGQSEIVAVGLLVDENEESLSFFIEAFKNSNPSWENVKVIMADKDKTERKVFGKHFPDSKLMICLFHTFQIFNREISTKKMSITQEDVIKSKTYLQKLAYASSHQEYEKISAEMSENVPEPVNKYFSDNWADIADQWARCYTLQNLCLSNTTNNRLESLNAKLKSVITRYSPLEDFIKHLFVYINSYRCSKDVNVSQMLNKRLAKPLETGSAKSLYCDLLTTFAYTQVKRQIVLAECYKDKDLTHINDDLILMSSSEGLLQVTPFSCECLFLKSNQLPCRHIFKCRELLSLPLFEPTLCRKRWTRQYCADILQNDSHEETHNTPAAIHNTLMETEVSCQILKNDLKASLSSHKKFTILDGYGKRMAQLSSEVSTKVFHERVKLIRKVIEMWEEGKDSVLKENFSRLFKSDAEKSQEISIHCEEHSESQESTNTAIDNQKSVLNQSCSIDEKLAESGTKEQPYEIVDSTANEEAIIFETQNQSQVKLDVSIPEDKGNRNSINVKDIKMPRNVLKRGRPKGFGNTVIGLKRQKSMKTKTSCKTPPGSSAETEQYLEEEYLEEYLDDEV